jgi:hypothetical protein
MNGTAAASKPSTVLARAARGVSWRLDAIRHKIADANPRFLAVLREVRRASGRGALEVAGDLLAAWADLDCDPVTYASIMLWEAPRATRQEFFVGPELRRFMAKTDHPEDSELADDKALIAALDARSGLPWPATLAVANRRNAPPIPDAVAITSKREIWPRLDELRREHGDLALKPAKGRRGVGFFRVAAGGEVHDADGRALSPAALADAVFEYRYRNSTLGYLVQRALTPSPSITELTGVDVLTTARVVTALAHGDVHVVESFLKIPDPRRLTDNFRDGSTGTFVAGFDPVGGRLSDLVGMTNPRGRYALERTARHPVTGRQISGETLPGARDIVALAMRAARAHPRTATFGWDIAIATNGLFVIDANNDWGPGWQPCARVGVRHLLHRLYPDDFRPPLCNAGAAP